MVGGGVVVYVSVGFSKKRTGHLARHPCLLILRWRQT